MSNFSLINKENIKNSNFVLDEKESHHVISVLRIKKNDQLILTDGKGTIYQAIVNEAHKKAVKGKILNKEHIIPERNFKIHLAIPLIKNNRFKIALEKSVELGVDELTIEIEDGTSVSDLEKIVREKALGKLDGVTLRTAINRKYISDNAILNDGDEIAFIPPVQGG